jgi:proteasome lid subunit RPN8/RPN11
VLRFSPPAWAKLLFLRDQGPTEIGGFGIARAGDPLFIEDVVLVRQSCTAITVRFEDEAVADFFDRQIDLGRKPESFARVWIHTHPGNSATPSHVDERTFRRAFGACDWAVMAILARGGESYARLRFNTGPGGELLIPVRVDYRTPFRCSDEAVWEAEYHACVQPDLPVPRHDSGLSLLDSFADWGLPDFEIAFV